MAHLVLAGIEEIDERAVDDEDRPTTTFPVVPERRAGDRQRGDMAAELEEARRVRLPAEFL